MGKGVAYRHGFAHVEGEYYLALEEAQDTVWTSTIASVFDSDQPQEEYPWLGQTPKVRKWTAGRTSQELRDDVITIVNDEFETGIVIPLREWRRDKTGQLRARVGELADSTVEHSMDLLSALIIANGNAYDGVAYFATSHAVGGVTINNNILAADGLAGGAAPTVTEQAANIQKLLERMLAFKGDLNRPINRRGRAFTLMIPTNMLGATMGALGNQFVAGGVSNTMQAVKAFGFTFDVIVNSDLTATNQLYLFRTDARIKPFIYQEELINVAGLDEGSEYAHMHNAVRFDVDISCGAGYGRFELGIRGTTS